MSTENTSKLIWSAPRLITCGITVFCKIPTVIPKNPLSLIFHPNAVGIWKFLWGNLNNKCNTFVFFSRKFVIKFHVKFFSIIFLFVIWRVVKNRNNKRLRSNFEFAVLEKWIFETFRGPFTMTSLIKIKAQDLMLTLLICSQ